MSHLKAEAAFGPCTLYYLSDKLDVGGIEILLIDKSRIIRSSIRPPRMNNTCMLYLVINLALVRMFRNLYVSLLMAKALKP